MTDKDRYTIGWSDYRAEHGTPKVEWEPIESNKNYDLEEIIAYVGMAAGVSMVIAPMAWVGLIASVLG
jgi:phosphoribosylcarboxyaminoimidazole (NCAIR) mutase